MSIFLQADSLAVANQILTDDQPVEQTLSIWSLLTSGGIGGQAIILVLFILLFFALFLYFERIMAINKASKIDSSFMNNIKMNIASGKIDNAKMICAQSNSPVARLIETGFLSMKNSDLSFMLTVVFLLLSVFPFAFGRTKSNALVVTIVDVNIKKINNKNTISVIDDILNSVETLFLVLPNFIILAHLISQGNLLHWLPFDLPLYLF